MIRLGGPAVRAGLLPLKGPPRIPEPGQYVELRTEDGSWRRGFRAITEPSTSEWGEVVVWVATEDEYRAAQREGRSAVGVPWPTERMVVSSSGLPWGLPHPTATRPVEGARRLGWRWRLPAYPDDPRAAVGLWSLLAITLLMAAVAVYSLLTGTVILGGG